MFQEYALFPHRDVAGNVEFGLRMAGDRPRRAQAARRRGARPRRPCRRSRDRRVAALSGGEQQRVAPGARTRRRAAAAHARRTARRARPAVARAAARARSASSSSGHVLPALYVTHDHEEAFALADRVVMMRAGRVVQAGVARRRCGGTRPTSGPPRSSASAPRSTARSAPTASPRRGGRSPSRRERGARCASMVRPDAVTIDGAGPIAGRCGAARVHGRPGRADRRRGRCRAARAGPGPVRARGGCAGAPRDRRRRACWSIRQPGPERPL